MTDRRRYVVAMVVPMLCLAAAIGAAPASADDPEPETPEEFLAEFLALSDVESYETYAEFETVRSIAVSEVQVGEFSGDDRTEMQAVLELLIRFDEAVEATEDGDYEAGLELADEAADRQAALEDRGVSYAVLAELALDRFYAELGDDLRVEADEQPTTADRIEFLSLSATAYERAGASDQHAQLTVEAESLESSYQEDLDRIEDAQAAGETYLERCTNCDSPVGALASHGIGVVGLYGETIETGSELDRTVTIAEGHGLSAEAADNEELAEDVSAQRLSLGLAASLPLVGYTGVAGLFGMLLLARLGRWRGDLERSRVGDIVVMERETHA